MSITNPTATTDTSGVVPKEIALLSFLTFLSFPGSTYLSGTIPTEVTIIF